MYYLFYALLWLINLLPLRVLYLLSDLAWLLLQYVLRYRRKVVRLNLTRSFPEKSLPEIRRIERRFYRQFCDTLVEGVHGITMSPERLKKHMTFGNTKAIEDYVNEGRTVILTSGHYGNYEWLTAVKLFFETDVPMYTVYRRIKSAPVEKLMNAIRSKWRNVNIDKNESVRAIEMNQRNGIRAVYGLVSDQKPSPTNPNRWYWTRFLHQDTPFLTGAEHFSVKYDCPVMYGHVERLARGRYHCEFELLAEHPAALQPGELTELFARRLEKDLMEAPEYWLWTHKRWKYAVPEGGIPKPRRY